MNIGLLTLSYTSIREVQEAYGKEGAAAICKQLVYVRCDIGYLEQFLSQGCVPDKKDIQKFLTILKVYRQQKYMYDHEVNSVPKCIVSISQPWPPHSEGQGHGPCGVRCQIRPDPGCGWLWGSRRYPLTPIMRGHSAGGCGALQGAYWALSGEGPSRPDIQDAR